MTWAGPIPLVIHWPGKNLYIAMLMLIVSQVTPDSNQRTNSCKRD